jgi:DNA-binding MarR family transcriptional regulator
VPELASRQGAGEKPAESPHDDNSSREEAITGLGTAFRHAFRSLRSMRGRDTHRGDEIGHAQFELLMELCVRGPLHAGELAEVVGASAATVSGMLDNLCAAELVERSRSESDRRLVVVRLTRRGKRKVEARKALWRRRWEEALEGVDEDELRVAARVLDRIGGIFDERPEGQARR